MPRRREKDGTALSNCFSIACCVRNFQVKKLKRPSGVTREVTENCGGRYRKEGGSMSLVVPFRALRPGKPYVRKVAAPPYDVLNVAEARKLVGENPLSFLHVEKSEIDVPDAAGVEDRRIYDRAKVNLEEMIRRGILPRFTSTGYGWETVSRPGSWPQSALPNTRPERSGGTS
jgi:hypothetical protein